MRKKKTNDYFDDFDFGFDEPKSAVKNPYQNDISKNDDDLEELFFFDTPGQTGRSASRKKNRNTRKNSVGKLLLKSAAAVGCLLAVALISGHLFGDGSSSKPTQPVATQPAATQPTYSLENTQPTSPEPTVSVTQPLPVVQNDYRYFANLLSKEQQKAYDIIEKGISQRDDVIGPFEVASEEELELIVRSVFYDYAEYFWFRCGYSSSYYDRETHLEMTLFPSYQFSAQEYLSHAAFVEASVQPVLSQLAGKSDYEKVKGVYEFLIDNTAYDLDYTGTTIYEMFHARRGVCEGYARATQYLLTKLGVETLYCTGMSGEIDEPKSKWESHAWNIVKIDGIYYGVDTTWGDPLTDDGSQVKSFAYLNLTDEEMNRRHEREEWAVYPDCTAIKDNYYVAESIYLDYFEKDAIKAFFQDCYYAGKPFVFKCANETIYRQAYSWLVDNKGYRELFESVIPPNQSYQYSYQNTDDLYILEVNEI